MINIYLYVKYIIILFKINLAKEVVTIYVMSITSKYYFLLTNQIKINMKKLLFCIHELNKNLYY